VNVECVVQVQSRLRQKKLDEKKSWMKKKVGKDLILLVCHLCVYPQHSLTPLPGDFSPDRGVETLTPLTGELNYFRPEFHS
jgi:hypothetical protein